VSFLSVVTKRILLIKKISQKSLDKMSSLNFGGEVLIPEFFTADRKIYIAKSDL